ncbi:MAG: hypothetical protein AAGA69_10705 [Pseudomonadota bacterium]
MPGVDPYAVRRALRTAAPSIALFIAVILLVTPLRLFQGYVPTPWVPMIIIFLYAVYEPEALPPAVVFAAGLFHDLLYGAGIGVWATVYLGLQYMVYSQHEYLDGRLPRVVWMAFAVAAFIAALVLYLLRSFLAGGFLPMGPLFYQLFITVAVYRLATMIFFYLRARAARSEEHAS